jgi:DNA topoisomerase-2
MSIEEKYQQLEHREHVYKLPDTYIGSIEPTSQEMFVVKNEDQACVMIKRQVNYVPGFLKIFDEILVNAIDHRQRDESVKNIKVTLNKGLGEIIIQNDGQGIDIAIHAGTKLYVPEMLFGHLLTSSNYKEGEQRTTGGKNGYGAKIVSIFSKYFIIETIDSNRQLKYNQKFTENNKQILPPKITKNTSKPYTKITFMPDYQKFGLVNGITDDLYDLLSRRVYDVTAVTPIDLNVYLNGTRIKIKSMEKYIQLYNPAHKVFYLEQPRWKIGLVLSPNREFNQISFVNGIWTMKGGRHVDHILSMIVEKVRAVLGRNNKTRNKVFKPSQIKDNIWLFVDSIIVNPSFTSQTKEELTTKVSQFGSSCDLDEAWIEKWMKYTNCDGDSFIERMVETLQVETDKSLKKTDGSKKSIIRGIPKLEDAIHAGTRRSNECTLILTEGDSAKSSILAGLSVFGSKFRDTFGVFPLRGKFINVRDTGLDKVSANEEVKNLKTILGLQQGKVYTQDNIKDLRYGSIALATDSDVDGAHIKALILNFLHFYWPSLLQIDGFIKSYITPIVKGFRGKETVLFYTLNDYHQFKERHVREKWTYKYYKGLGTSTGKEFREYFQNISDITKYYKWDSDQALVMAFSKSLANQRKDWLKIYDPQQTIEYRNGNQILLTDFVHKDLKHFSNYDNIRSIPNVLDGLKPSQRKVLYGIFKKGKGEIKVAQLASYVSEQTSYHHGEVSLEQTIVSLAQQFVGKSNLPTLQAKGQFGSRLQGGSDHAQSRYIFTELFDYTRILFHELDDPLLKYNEEESKTIEPVNYYPILPWVLVSGVIGIGTGYSTSVPNFNPKEIIDAMIERNQGITKEFKKEWIPWYKGFKGVIEPTTDPLKFNVWGNYTLNGKKLVINELPIGMWTQPYKEHLDHLIETGLIVQYLDKSTDESVWFEIVLTEKVLSNVETIPQQFKLLSKISLNNMHLYRPEGSEIQIHKFESVQEILEYYYTQRLGKYLDRKMYILKRLTDRLQIVKEKIRFIRLVIEKPETVFRKSKSQIQKELVENGFIHIDTLLTLPIYSWSEEKIKEYEKERDSIQQEIEKLSKQTPEQLWNKDLEELLKLLK